MSEAVPGGVKAVEYWSYMTGGYDIKVRRLRNASEATRARLHRATEEVGRARSEHSSRRHRVAAFPPTF